MAANGSPGSAGVNEPVPVCGAPFANVSRSPNSRWGRSASPDPQARAVDAAASGGLMFVGIDVIGDYLTEINVTSPTGAVQLKAFEGTDAGDLLWDCIEAKRES